MPSGLWALVAAASVAGCTCRAPSGTATVRLQAFGDPVEISAYRTLIRAFEERHPDVKVELLPVGKQRDHMARLTTAFSGGVPPDLFLLNYRRFGQFAGKDVLEPLGPKLGGRLKESDFYPQALDAFRFQGQLVCLPQNVSSLVVYWNRALFAKAQVAPPRDGWTWDEFAKAAVALTRDTTGDGRPDVHGLAFEPTLIRIAPFVLQAGGSIVDHPEHPRALMFRTPEAYEALAFLLRLRNQGVMPTLEQVRAQDVESRFAHGQVAMLLHSRRFTPTLRSLPELDWDVAALPVGRRPATVLHSDGYCLAKRSGVKAAAFKFVEFALGDEGAELLARSGRTVPSLRRVAESEAFLGPSARPASARVFLDSIQHAHRTPSVAIWNEVETRADAVVEEWFYGGSAAEARTPPTVQLAAELERATHPVFASGPL